MPGRQATLASYAPIFNSAAAYVRTGVVRRRSGSGDVAHGVVEAQAEHAHEEVDGVAGQVALGPAPVAVFNEQSWIGGQRNERGEPGGADLVTSRARRQVSG